MNTALSIRRTVGHSSERILVESFYKRLSCDYEYESMGLRRTEAAAELRNRRRIDRNPPWFRVPEFAIVWNSSLSLLSRHHFVCTWTQLELSQQSKGRPNLFDSLRCRFLKRSSKLSNRSLFAKFTAFSRQFSGFSLGSRCVRFTSP